MIFPQVYTQNKDHFFQTLSEGRLIGKDLVTSVWPIREHKRLKHVNDKI